MTQGWTHRVVGAVLVGGLLCAGVAVSGQSQAASLRDLIKRAPELYLPSQMVPGKEAVFTVKGQPGQSVRVVVSAKDQGASLPSGIALGVGKAVVEKTAVVPASGVASVVLTLPTDSEDLIPGDTAYVDAVVWSQEGLVDAQRARVIQPNGVAGSDNSVFVAEEADPGAMLVVPGDSGMTQMMRAMSTLGEANGDPRKRQLLDDGTINRNRLLDRNLNAQPTTQTGF